MNISSFASGGEVFVNYEYVKGYAFRNAVSWVESALLPIICADFSLLWDKCAHFCRIRMECLLPHIASA